MRENALKHALNEDSETEKHEIVLKMKKACGACQMVRFKLGEWGLDFEMVESSDSVPRLVVDGVELEPPLTSSKMRKFLRKRGLRVR